MEVFHSIERLKFQNKKKKNSWNTKEKKLVGESYQVYC